MNEIMQRIINSGAVVAHRGCWDSRAPENSLTALRRAADAKLPIELDVHLTSDKQVVVFHDSSLLRMCICGGKIEEMPAAEVTAKRLAFTKERIPLFSDVLAAVDGRVAIYIELKCRGNEIELADALLDCLKSYKGDYVFIGFYPKAAKYLKEKGYPVGFSCAKPPAPTDFPYEPDCIIGHILGVPTDEKLLAQYPPFVPWTVSTAGMRRKAERVSAAAIYNTKKFKEFKKFHKGE